MHGAKKHIQYTCGCFLSAIFDAIIRRKLLSFRGLDSDIWLKPKKMQRKRRLKNLSDCIRAGQWLWNELALDLIEPSKAGKLAFLLNIQKGILQAIESLEIERKQLNNFEERLEIIETELKNKN
jgi:hypothetical protein